MGERINDEDTDSNNDEGRASMAKDKGKGRTRKANDTNDGGASRTKDKGEVGPARLMTPRVMGMGPALARPMMARARPTGPMTPRMVRAGLPVLG